jgi:cation diffusion facilitator family transporter
MSVFSTVMKKERMAALAVMGGVLIFAIKLSAYFISDSVALLSDALESIVNIVASVMMFVSIRIAMMPADDEHKYGHQRAENISCLIEGILIIIAAILIIAASAGRLMDPQPFDSISIALIVSLVATGMNGGLSYFMGKAAQQNGSIALEGDAKHLLSDVVSSIGIVIGLFLAEITGWYILDPILALVVALFLIKMAYSVLMRTCRDLMDSRCPESEGKIKEIMQRQTGFLEFHGLKTRRVGENVYAEMHICVEAQRTVAQGHELTDRIEKELLKEMPYLIVIIHLETEKEMVSASV